MVVRKPSDMRSIVIGDLATKTGRNLDDWIVLIRRKGPRDQTGVVSWLKNDHGMGHVTAQIVAKEAFNPASTKSR